MARHGLPRTFLLPLVCITTLFHFELVKADVRVPCGMVKDWFPSGTKPQSSQPPYMLNVTDPDGNMDEPYYASRQKPYTSEYLFFFLCMFLGSAKYCLNKLLIKLLIFISYWGA